ncbi:MAG: hypothetical protein RR202_01250 [Bacteroidales bacterium]
MKLEVSEEKTKQMVDRYNNDPDKGTLSRKEYAQKLAKDDPNFVPWLFDFEQNELRSDLSTGMSRTVNTALDNWIDIYHNY